MSSFLLNLARRAAGLPVGAVKAMSTPPFVRTGRVPDLVESGPVMTQDASPPGPALSRRPAAASPLPVPESAPRSPNSGHAAEPDPRGRPARSTQPGPPPGPAPSTDRGAPAAITARRAPVSERVPTEPLHGPPAASRETVELSTGADEPSSDGIPRITLCGDGLPQARVAARVIAMPDRLRSISPARGADDAPSAPVIRPAPLDSPFPTRLPRRTLVGPPNTATAAPVLVRIGRVEVRGAPAPRQAPSPGPPAPSGFAAYERVRTYRSWPG